MRQIIIDYSKWPKLSKSPHPSLSRLKKPDDWPKWTRRFERFRSASALDQEDDVVQVDALIYAMGDETGDIL